VPGQCANLRLFLGFDIERRPCQRAAFSRLGIRRTPEPAELRIEGRIALRRVIGGEHDLGRRTSRLAAAVPPNPH
jgi:hypothetical protein